MGETRSEKRKEGKKKPVNYFEIRCCQLVQLNSVLSKSWIFAVFSLGFGYGVYANKHFKRTYLKSHIRKSFMKTLSKYQIRSIFNNILKWLQSCTNTCHTCNVYINFLAGRHENT